MLCSGDKEIDSKAATKVQVSSDGTCSWMPPGRFASICGMDITWFPYDDQTCELNFASWTYNGFQLHLQLERDNMILLNYYENGEWDVIGTIGGVK